MRLSLKVGQKVVINLKMYQREKSPSFVIFQAHAQWLNLTASMDAIAVPSRVVTGRNICLVSVIGAGDAAVWYLLALNNVDVLVMAVIYYDAGLCLEKLLIFFHYLVLLSESASDLII